MTTRITPAPLAILVLTIAAAVLCPAPTWAETDQPRAELKLGILHHKRAHGEYFDFVLTITNTGKAPIPIIDDKGYGIISTEQIFIVSRILEMNENRPMTTSTLKAGDDQPISPDGPAQLFTELQGRNLEEVAQHHWGYLGGVDTANWQRVVDQETNLLQPGEQMVFTERTTRYHDHPTPSRHISKFNWQVWLLIGDGIWAKSNIITIDMVDQQVREDGEVLRMLETPIPIRHEDLSRKFAVRRLIVDDEQWVYYVNLRIATLPTGLELKFFWNMDDSMLWLRVPGRPELNVQVDRRYHLYPPEEQTVPDPAYLIPTPDALPELPRR